MNQKWVVKLTCCGRDEGTFEFYSWEDADAFREAYTSGPGVHPHGYSAPMHAPGHRRSGLIISPQTEGSPDR